MEAALHGDGVAGGIDDDIVPFAAGLPLGDLFRVCIGKDRRVCAEFFDGEGETVLTRVHDGDMRATGLGEDDRRHADRAGTGDEHAILGRDRAALYTMGADGEELDHRGIFERDVASRDNVAFRHAEIFRHAAIAMDAEDGNVAAGIADAAAAGLAGAAGEIGDDVDGFALLEPAAGRCFRDGARQFMAHDARIFEKRMFSGKDVKIGAAYADMADADFDLAFAACRFGTILQRKSAGLDTDERLHDELLGWFLGVLKFLVSAISRPLR
ncbi:hypothetical protein D3C73_623650 [compost metagenome]